MQKTVLAMALMFLVGGADALAQGASSVPKNSGATGTPARGPVGNRQPRPADLPNQKNLSDPNDPLSKENAALDKKIKSICRGC